MTRVSLKSKGMLVTWSDDFTSRILLIIKIRSIQRNSVDFSKYSSFWRFG